METIIVGVGRRGFQLGGMGSPVSAPFHPLLVRKHRLKLRIAGYVDDFLLFATDKTTLWEWQEAIQQQLAGLRLTIHPGSQPQPTSEGIPFLGFHIFPDHRRLKRRKGILFRRRLARLLKQYEQGELELKEVHASVRGWVNHVRFANTVGLRKKLFRKLPIPKAKKPKKS